MSPMKGSAGAKACEFAVQPALNMCGPGGSTEQPAVQQSRKEQSVFIIKNGN